MDSSRLSSMTQPRKRSSGEISTAAADSSTEGHRSLRSARKTRRSSLASDDMDGPSSTRPTQRPRRQVPGASPSSEDDGDARLTKTGRVSRALKGQPVHKCDVCEKFYTRAEHLRRHQSSHKNQSAWLCNVPGCERSYQGKGFAREDLLTHHREVDHNVDSYPAISSHPSPGLPAFALHQPEPPTSYPEVMSRGFGSQYDSSYGNPVTPYSELRQPITTMPGTLPPDAFTAHSSSMATASYSYTSPGGFVEDQRHQSIFNPSRSLSPASCLSPFSVPTWSNLDSQASFRRNSPTCSDYTVPTSVSSPSLLGLPFDAPCPEIVSLIDLDEQDSALIEGDVAHLAGMTSDSIGHATFWLLEDRYMPYFWQCFNPSFPIIHRGTYFAATDIPVVLKALMVAVGASFVQDNDARIVTETLCSSASDILKRHEIPLSHSRTWDLHIAFLAEALSLYRSRRPAQGLSVRFESLATMLQFDPSISSMHFSDGVSSCTSTEALSAAHIVWVEQETRRRLLLASYVLETQQATLFERHRDLAYTDMTLPCIPEIWETQDLFEWQSLMQGPDSGTAYLYDVLDRPESVRYDAFTSAIIVSFTAGNKFTVTPPHFLLQSIMAQPQAEFTYHAMQLASHTPIRDILAIAGESFVLGEKMSSLLQFEQAKQDLQLWTRRESVSKAMYHAVHLLRTCFEKGSVGLIHEDWALYLSALVCWTVGVWTQRHTSQPPSPSSDQWQGTDPNDKMREFLARFEVGHDSTQSQCSDADSTRSCLSWTRNRLKDNVGGLVADAVHVLGRLADH